MDPVSFAIGYGAARGEIGERLSTYKYTNSAYPYQIQKAASVYARRTPTGETHVYELLKEAIPDHDLQTVSTGLPRQTAEITHKHITRELNISAQNNREGYSNLVKVGQDQVVRVPFTKAVFTPSDKLFTTEKYRV